MEEVLFNVFLANVYDGVDDYESWPTSVYYSFTNKAHNTSKMKASMESIDEEQIHL